MARESRRCQSPDSRVAAGLSCLHAGLETLLGGATALVDHLWVRNIDDVAAAVAAYRSLGVRVWLALMLGDTAGDNYASAFALAAAQRRRCG